MTTSITRADLQALQGVTPKLIRWLEELAGLNGAVDQVTEGTIAATRAIQDATVLTLSPNTAFTSERILVFDTASFSLIDAGPGAGYSVGLLNTVCHGLLEDAVDDAAAAALGVEIGCFYRNGSVVMQRVT